MARLDEMRFDPARLNKASAADYSSSESDGVDEDEYLMPSRNPHDSEFADYNPRKRRRTGRDPKESAALGIFGSESEDEGPSRSWKHKSLRNKGVSFVSSGKTKADSDEEEDAEEEQEEDEYDDANPGAVPANAEDAEDDDEEDEDTEMGGVGLDFKGASATAGQGLGWTPSMQQAVPSSAKIIPPRKAFVGSKFNNTNPLGNGFTPMSERGPTLRAEDDEPAAPRAAMPSAFSKARGGKTKINTNSFGARMMAKMGYVEGTGLGKEGQGRNVIVEANLRPQGVGLGAVKEKNAQEREEEKRQARMRGEAIVDSEEEEKKKKAARRKKALAGGVSSGAGSGASTPRVKKPKYLTVDEIKKAAPGLNIPDAFTPILDMTGPGKKLLTTSSGLMTPTGGLAPQESAEAAENRKLAKRAQNDFMAILEEWQSLQERKAYLDLQLKQEQQELEELAASLQGNKSVAAACEAASKHTESGELDRKADISYKLTHVITSLAATSTSLSDAMLPQIKSELSTLTVAAIHPLLNQFRQLWSPLEEPSPPFLSALSTLCPLLGLDANPTTTSKPKTYRKPSATPYETMMHDLWLRTAAAAVRDEWNVRDPDPLLALLDAWEALLPRFVRAQLLADVVRRLDEAVRKWQPRKHSSTNLPHKWIFPWLPYLPTQQLDPRSTTGLVADVRRKFRQLVDAWDFGRGVVPGLRQWRDVLRPAGRGKDDWTPLVMNHLLPGLAGYLRKNFRVDPQDQAPYVEVLDRVVEWREVLRADVLGEVLVAEVFPLWHDALYRWLLLEEANYEEIGQWFTWWRDDVFPDEIKALPAIVAEFEKGTAMIERALDLGERVATELKPPEKGPALKRESRRRREEKKEEPAPPPPPVAPEPVGKKAEEVSFRQVIEEWCQDHDLQFMPERNKVHAEGPLYRISGPEGKRGVLVYFKGNCLFAQVKDRSPIEIRRENEDEWGVLIELVA
ncbi:GC-rich sequence DNA-binding factor-like protein-domain-containing protein [Staphylotrichum tortipilum]|uniref:GC-rich sequence DNA-binding factor-like protein-domain-containing protein n=1 Tax=Staphylotrichum tortipilum TaxID=2831512 RepID=A0AAN6MR14_9PEZI|nr:GC-rich sequence DNA-binding factor-like protein-domain-containing protein [Staphylotrichum longicolle]